MASTTIKSDKRKKQQSKKKLGVKPIFSTIFSRRVAAWGIELAIFSASIAVPYGLGSYIKAQGWGKPVPLNPTLAQTQSALAKTLTLPAPQNPNPLVPPATNLFWWLALGLPITLSATQIYRLGRTGQTLPKRWLGIRVVTPGGAKPGLARAIVREIVGKWGVPLSSAYLIWRYSGAFPALGVLIGTAGVAILAEISLLLFNRRQSTWHDRLAGTIVVDAKKGLTSYNSPYKQARGKVQQEPLTVEVQPLSQEPTNPITSRAVSTIIYNSPAAEKNEQFQLWQWMRQNPGPTLTLVTIGAVGSVLTTFVGTQIYIQTQANQRQYQARNNQVFLSLVDRLGATSQNPTEERKSVILALARLDDPRAIPLLVDLLGQETNPTLIDTLQQALASTGTNSLPALRNLNQAIHNDLAALVNSETGRKTANLRLRATKQAIAKVLNIYSGRLQNSNLQRIDLSSVTAGEGEFNLILEQVDLSGLNLRSSLLRDSDFYKSIFYSAGKDRRLGTFDDVTSDFSGADLQGANLSETLLNKAKFKRANLIQVNLSKANISEANFQQANLSSAKLIAVNGQYSQFKQASLTGADLTKSDFTSSNWQSANLGKSSAIGTKFIQSNLQQSNWQGADLSQTDFTNSDLSSTDLSYSQLRAAKLQNVNLTNANLSYADLSSADLRGANLKNANFLGVVLVESIKSNIDSFMPTPTSQSAVKIQGVDFSEVKNLSDEQIEFICNNGGYHPFCRNR